MPGLTPKQSRFVAEYVVDHNGTQAAIRAGYSAKTAYSIGSENLRKPEVAAAIAAEEASVADRLGITRHFIYSGFRYVFQRAVDRERPDLAQANRSLEALARLVLHPPAFDRPDAPSDIWSDSWAESEGDRNLRQLIAELEDRVREERGEPR